MTAGAPRLFSVRSSQEILLSRGSTRLSRARNTRWNARPSFAEFHDEECWHVINQRISILVIRVRKCVGNQHLAPTQARMRPIRDHSASICFLLDDRLTRVCKHRLGNAPAPNEQFHVRHSRRSNARNVYPPPELLTSERSLPWKATRKLQHPADPRC